MALFQMAWGYKLDDDTRIQSLDSSYHSKHKYMYFRTSRNNQICDSPQVYTHTPVLSAPPGPHWSADDTVTPRPPPPPPLIRIPTNINGPFRYNSQPRGGQCTILEARRSLLCACTIRRTSPPKHPVARGTTNMYIIHDGATPHAHM